MQRDLLYKIILVGDSTVGKTCLITKVVNNTFSLTTLSTIGVDFHIKSCVIDSKKVQLQIWDTAGQDRFRAITATFYRKSHGILLMFDITREATFNNLESWMRDVKEKTIGQEFEPIIYLIGSKSDLGARRVISKERASEFASKYNMKYYEISSKLGENLDIFDKLALDVYRKHDDHVYKKEQSILIEKNKQAAENQSCWC